MARAYKMELVVVDVNGEYDNQDVNSYPTYIEGLIEEGYFVSIARKLNLEVSDKFEWADDLKINKIHASNEDFEKYFLGGNLK